VKPVISVKARFTRTIESRIGDEHAFLTSKGGVRNCSPALGDVGEGQAHR
jgi:hypothetical protein